MQFWFIYCWISELKASKSEPHPLNAKIVTVFIFFVLRSAGTDAEEEANFFVSIVDITIMIASPSFGLLVDFSGFNGWAGIEKFNFQSYLTVK